jgi:hypothetical protein
MRAQPPPIQAMPPGDGERCSIAATRHIPNNAARRPINRVALSQAGACLQVFLANLEPICIKLRDHTLVYHRLNLGWFRFPIVQNDTGGVRMHMCRYQFEEEDDAWQ